MLEPNFIAETESTEGNSDSIAAGDLLQ